MKGSSHNNKSTRRRSGITDDRGRSPRSVGGGGNHARRGTGKSGAPAAKPSKTKNY